MLTQWMRKQFSLPQKPDSVYTHRTGNNELRTTGVVSAVGDNLLLSVGGYVRILEITIQPQVQTTVRFFVSNTPITAQWTLQPFQFWSSPGMEFNPLNRLVLALGSAGTVNFEIRWSREEEPPLRLILDSLIDNETEE